MSKQDESSSPQDGAALTRRHFLSGSAAALAATVAVAPLAAAQQTLPARPAGVPVTSPDHHLPNEQQPGTNNTAKRRPEPGFCIPPPLTDNGSVLPFKYSFDQSHKEVDPVAGRVRSPSATFRSLKRWLAWRCISSRAVCANCTGMSPPSGRT